MGIRLDGTTDTISAPGSDLNIGHSGDSVKIASQVQLPTHGALSNRNLVINGAMQVAQRGSSSTSSGYQTVDRFKTYHTQVSVTQSRQTLSSGSPYDEGFRFFLRMANTSTSSSTASQASIQYRFEAQDLASSGWNYKSSSSYATFSFWVRSSLAGTYYISYRNTDANPLTYNASFTLGANTWTKVTQTIPGDSNVVFNSDNGEGMRLSFIIHFGTDNTGSNSQVDAWHDRVGSDYLPDFAQNWSNTSGATFDVTGVQFEVGEKATPFEHRSIGDDQRLCFRYYQEAGIILSNTSPDRYYATIQLPVQMRDSPTITAGGIDSGSGGSMLALYDRSNSNSSKTFFYQGADNSVISNAWFKFDDEL